METKVKDGYYTKPYTNDTVAVIKGKILRVAMLENKYTSDMERFITNEHISVTDRFLETCRYEPFQKERPVAYWILNKVTNEPDIIPTIVDVSKILGIPKDTLYACFSRTKGVEFENETYRIVKIRPRKAN